MINAMAGHCCNDNTQPGTPEPNKKRTHVVSGGMNKEKRMKYEAHGDMPVFVNELHAPIYAFGKFHYAHKRVSKLIYRCERMMASHESVNIRERYDFGESVRISLVAETENQLASLSMLIAEAVKNNGVETDSIKKSRTSVDLLNYMRRVEVHHHLKVLDKSLYSKLMTNCCFRSKLNNILFFENKEKKNLPDEISTCKETHQDLVLFSSAQELYDAVDSHLQAQSFFLLSQEANKLCLMLRKKCTKARIGKINGAIEETEQLLQDIKTLFNRCQIDLPEGLSRLKDIQIVDKKIKDDVLRIDPEIIRCAIERNRVYIDVNRDSSQEAKERIEDCLKTKLNGIKYAVNYTTTILSDFASPVSRGDKVGCSNCIYGTIGCFVGDSENNIYALTSKHVAKEFDDAIVLGNEFLGNIMTPHAEINDIAAVRIREVDGNKIDQNWKYDAERYFTCELLSCTDEELITIKDRFDLVFIRGATTISGEGEIESFAVDRDGCKMFLIKDIANSRTNFCDRGDSGAIVLAEGADRKVYALGILKGHDDVTNRYVAHVLAEGLRELSMKHNNIGYYLRGGSSLGLSRPAL